jgi:hypothetical protein
LVEEVVEARTDTLHDEAAEVHGGRVAGDAVEADDERVVTPLSSSKHASRSSAIRLQKSAAARGLMATVWPVARWRALTTAPKAPIPRQQVSS